MIGGRVLDHTALGYFVQGSIYAHALVRTALTEGMVLAVPSAALAAAWATMDSDFEGRVLNALLDMPMVVTEPLDRSSAHLVGRLLAVRDVGPADLATAHVVHSARSRGWAVLTADAGSIHRIGDDVEVDELP